MPDAPPPAVPPNRSSATTRAGRPRVQQITALLASAAALGGLAELAMLRHWSGVQLVPWVILSIILITGVVTARGGSRLLARVAAGLGLIGAVAGGYFHVTGNHALGPHLIENWDALGVLEQWWAAFSGTIGANPALAPGLLALAGALLLVSVMKVTPGDH